MDFWTLSLVVEVDAEWPLLTAHVRVAGGTPFHSGVVRVNPVDGDHIGGPVEHPLRPDNLGTELRMPSIRLADRELMEEALRRGWEVRVYADGVERIRWRRYLSVGPPVFDVGAEIHFATLGHDIRPKAEDEGWGPEAPWDARDTDRLLANLVGGGVISESDRNAVLADAAQHTRTVERALVERGLLSDREMLEEYAKVTGCEFLDLRTYPIDPDAMRVIPADMGREYGLAAVGYHGDFLTVAMSDPQNVEALRAVEWLARPYIALATREDVLNALDQVNAHRDDASALRS